MSTIRAFIAVTIPQSPLLRTLHERLSQFGESFRPVALNGLHVTLKFLGDTDDRNLPEIAAVLKRVAARHPAEDVRLTGLGAFPHIRRPTVIWVGMRNANSISAIAGELESNLKEHGFEPESRPFHPHLTVLRVKSRPSEALLSLLVESAETEYGTARIESVELFRSELLKGGSRYTVLAAAPLA